MASLDYNIWLMERIFRDEGYTIFNIDELDNEKITSLDESVFPVICIGEGEEDIDSTSTVGILNQESEISINIIFASGKGSLRFDAAYHLRVIKGIVFRNRNNCAWNDWIMINQYTSQLQSTNDLSGVFGGTNINCTVKYREDQSTKCFWLSGGEMLYSGAQIVSCDNEEPAVFAKIWQSGGVDLYSDNQPVIYPVEHVLSGGEELYSGYEIVI